MSFTARVALALGFFLGMIGSVWSDDGRGWPRGGGGISKTISETTVTATTVNATTGNFTFVDAGTGLFSGTVTSVVASGSDAFTMKTGARLCLLEGCSTRMLVDATNQIGFYIANAQTLKLNAGSGALTAPSGFFFSSEAASGANGFQCTTNGARIDFGAGASDYASSDGTTVTFAGPLSTASSTITAGDNLACGGGTVSMTRSVGTNTLQAATGDSITSATVPALALKATAALTAGDLLLGVQKSDGTNEMTLTQEGALVAVGVISSTATSGNQFACTGAATCNVASASGQTAGLDCGGGTCTAQLGATNATTTSIGRAGQTTDIKGGTITMQGTAMDFTFCVYNTGNLAGTVAFGETTFTHAVTVNTASKVTQDVVGVGAGNWVVKLCTDGTTCAGGNTYLTYTEACTAAVGTRTAATVQNSGTIPAGSVGTISVTTACATTDPAANICVHYTMP